MASCRKCGKGVGCSCNLIEGYCPSCYNTNAITPSITTNIKRTISTNLIQYSQPDAPATSSEFEDIVNTPNISKAEKIRRINEILERAKQKI
jgi:hypothetical protein